MAIASGVAKRVAFKKESTWGTAAGTSGGQYLRRVTSSLDLRKETYQSSEIRRDYQVSDMRHGVRSVDGSINGELSAGTWQKFLAAALRRDFGTAITSTALTNVTAAATAPQFVRAAGSFLTDGFKVGMVIRWTGWATTGTTNNSRNFLITALTATNMTGVFLDGTTPGAKASGDSVTALEVGKHTYAPASSHTDDSFSIEHWYSDIAQSELFTGCKLQSLGFQLPPTGIATVEGQFLGKDVTTATAEYYASVTAETTTGVLAAVNGALYLQGSAVALLTGLNFTINGNMSGVPVVGSNSYADINEGRIVVEGQITALFQDATIRDYFINETEVALTAVLTSANSATADFVAFTMPRIKVGGAAKDDGEKGLVQTLPFTALYLGTGGTGTANEATTLMIQDSQAA